MAMIRHSHAITPACPVACLRPVLSARAYNPLSQAGTVAEVVRLWRTGDLCRVWGLGPRRIGEIEMVLIVTGLATPHG
ncbi:hypothetical protein FHS44_001292 [Streptosporangium saharense]|uniref:Uncharacterized protein n=1 Tax=Streptosporangium saharense TaxID=1706840 RepID=A0A7W7VLI9_9ACTN|nr:hypothetical protein [Streptosporangium saharense]